MPKLPHVSGATIVKAREQVGFAKIRQSGSHVIKRRGSKGCVVPMHSEVKLVEPLQGFCARPTYRQTNSSRPCDLDVQLRDQA